VDHAAGSATRFWEKISLIAEISAACRRLKSEAPAFDEVLGLIQGIIPFDAASLYLRETGTDHYVLKAALEKEVRLPEMLIVRDRLRPDHWHSIVHQPLLWTPEGEYNQSERGDCNFIAILIAPLCVDSDTIGFLNLASYADGVLSEKQIKLMTVVADQLAVSAERLEYVACIEAQHRTLQQNHEQLRANQARLVADEKLTAVVELAATINHQINNPLSIIVGNVQCLALEETELSAKSRDRLRRVVDAALKVGEVNRRLLNIQTLIGDSGSVGSEIGYFNNTVSS
jgi:transcriptional regulator with GAF, ATPase, and Fis domain